MTDNRTAYERAVQDRTKLHYLIGLIARWKQQWKYKYARWVARKNGATIGEGVIMPISLAKRANNNLKVGNHVSIQTDKLDLRNPVTIGNQVIMGGGGVQKSLQPHTTSIRRIGSTSITALSSRITSGYPPTSSFCPVAAVSAGEPSLAVAALSSRMSPQCLLSAATQPRSSSSVRASTPTSSSRACSEETTRCIERRGEEERDSQNNLLLSIIIPAYKVEKYIARCLDSILTQGVNNSIEVIVVEDGVTDRCGEIADEYATRYNNVRVNHAQWGGVCSARNIGMEMAKGEFLFFVDADDYLVPNALASIIEELRKAQSDSFCFSTYSSNDGKELHKNRFYDARETLSIKEFGKMKPLRGTVWHYIFN